jgi:hypothetical protein
LDTIWKIPLLMAAKFALQKPWALVFLMRNKKNKNEYIQELKNNDVTFLFGGFYDIFNWTHDNWFG